MDADELYRRAPEDFTAARDAAAKQARADGDKDRATALKALRRPSLAAWLLNRLVAESPELVEQLLALGPDLAQAQSGGDADALRALGEQRRQLVSAVTTTAVAAGDRPVTAAVRDEVASTLEAALADPGSAEAVRSGRLVRALSYAGFGGVDLSDAVAPSTGRAPAAAPARPPRKGGDAAEKAREERVRRLAEAEATAHDAAGRLDDAVRVCEAAERDRAAAQQAEQDAAAEVDRLQEQLARAREEHERAAREHTAAQKAVDKAQGKVQRAQRRAEEARTELDRLRRDA